MELLLIFLAPVLQIMFSVLRITGQIKVPIGVIAFLAIIAGGILSFNAASLEMADIVAHTPKGHFVCGTPLVAFFLCGTLMNATAAIVIGGICAIIYSQINKKTPLA